MSVKKKIPHVFNKSFYGKKFQSKWRIERTKIDKFSMSVKKKIPHVLINLFMERNFINLNEK